MKAARTSKPFSATLVRDGKNAAATFQLLPSLSEVVFAKDASGMGYTPSTPVSLHCGYIENTVDGQEVTPGPVTDSNTNRIGGRYALFFRYIGSDGNPTDTDRTEDGWQWQTASLSIPSSTTYIAVEFALSWASGVSKNPSNASYIKVADSNIVDKQRVPILKDGLDGQPGDTGDEGRGILVIIKAYARSGDNSTVNDSTPPSLPSGEDWEASIPILNSAYGYLWCRETTYYTTGSPATTTRYYLIGTRGTPGQTGKVCHPAGDYSDNIEYTSNEYQTVSVEVPISGSTESETWVLEAATNVVNGVHIAPHDSGQTVWRQGTNTNLLKAKYLFADFANVGSFIAVGDWVLSANGECRMATGTTVPTSLSEIGRFQLQNNGRHIVTVGMTATDENAIVTVGLYRGNTLISSTVTLSASSNTAVISTTLSITGSDLILIKARSNGYGEAKISTLTLSSPVDHVYFDPAIPSGEEVMLLTDRVVNDDTEGQFYKDIRLTRGRTYKFRITGTLSGQRLTVELKNSSAVQVAYAYTEDEIFDMEIVYTPVSDGVFYLSDYVHSSGTAVESSVSFFIDQTSNMPVFAPTLAFDGKTGETFQAKATVRGDVEAARLLAVSDEFITEIRGGVAKFTSIKNPLAWLSIGADADGMALKMTDKNGRLIWNISTTGSGFITSGGGDTSTEHLVYLGTSEPGYKAYSNNCKGYSQEDCRTYWRYNGLWQMSGSSRVLQAGQEDYDGLTYQGEPDITNYTPSGTLIADGWYVAPNRDMFDCIRRSGYASYYSVRLLHYSNGKQDSSTKTVTFRL